MQSKKYIPFSEQDRLMASKVDLVSFLQLRGEKLERVGKEYKLIYTDVSGKHDSITVCGNRWYDHKNQVGGGPVKFLREHYGMSSSSDIPILLKLFFIPAPLFCAALNASFYALKHLNHIEPPYPLREHKAHKHGDHQHENSRNNKIIKRQL